MRYKGKMVGLIELEDGVTGRQGEELRYVKRVMREGCWSWEVGGGTRG